MAIGSGSRRHTSTEHVQIDVRRCTACGRCIAACPQGVLGMVAFFRHKHVHVDRADRCVGCLACVAACRKGAIADSRAKPPPLNVRQRT